ncbi:MAG: hypothetical protein FJZ64_01620, partial [Chlamydiae bacterium]|nr:hypothetical protein [Chlamydiota bacterium]
MLQFFRKYQKYCFFFVAVVIIATFSFFGTFSTFDRDEKQEDRTIAKKIDGSPLLLSEVRELARWLATDQMDLPDHGKMPNFCNDGVIRKDLLKTGIAALLVEAYFDVFKEEIVAKVDRAKRFKGYFHPDFPILSAAVVWERFAPKLQEELIHLREETEVSRKTFSILANLYERQNDFPTPMLRQILFMEEKRLGLRRDPMLEQGDISFLGLHSLTDWFGHDFLNLSAEFVLNAAVFAEEKGYRVSIEEAKGDLLCNFETFIQKRGIDRSKLPTFHEHLRSFGFDETGAAKIWQKVLLFRRVFQGI